MGLISRHNKYVSYPDWFGGLPKETAPTTPSASTSRIIYTGSSDSGLSSVTIYNKYVLKELTLDNTILTLSDTALIATKSGNNAIGDLITVPGWSTTEFIDVAANSTITVNTSVDSSYGIVYYDNTQAVISGEVLDTVPKELTVPNGACYFRISCLTDYTNFSIVNKVPDAYTESQLAISNSNVSDFTLVNTDIPEGINSYDITDESLKLLVQSPLELFKDTNNVIKLSIDGSIGGGNCEWELKTDELSGIEYLYSKYPVVTQYGVTMYADNTTLDLPGIYDGLPIDNSTIYWDVNADGDKVLKARTFGGDGTGTVTPDEILDVVATAGYATQFWVNTQLEKKADLDYVNKTFVTIAGNEDVTGVHDFVNGLKIGGNLIYELLDDILYIDSNVVVRGGLTMFYDNGEIDLPTIKDQIGNAGYDGSTGLASFNSNHFVITNGVVSLINPYDGSGTGGETVDLSKYALKTDLNRYVTLDTEQTITEIKDFKKGLKIDGLSISKSQDDVIYIDSNVIIRGGLTMFADPDADIPSLIESLPLASTSQVGLAKFHPDYFEINNEGFVVFIGETGESGGVADSIAWSKVTGKPTWLSDDKISYSEIDGIQDQFNKYLLLSGGTMTGTINSQIVKPKTANAYSLGTSSYLWSNTYTKRLTVDTIEMYQSQSDVLYIDGNLVVRGGITLYGDDAVSASTIMNGILVDNITISKSKGYLEVIGGVGGGGIDEDELESLLQSWGYVTEDDLPTSLKNPYSISWSGYSSGSYDGSAAKSFYIPAYTSDLYNDSEFITSSDLSGYATQTWVNNKGFLTSHQTIYNLTLQSGSFSAKTFDPNGSAQTVNIPTSTSHLSNDSGYITSSGSITGNAATATKLATARTISLTGNVTGSGSFDGSTNLSITTTIPTRNVIINGTYWTVHSTITTDTTGIYAPTSGGTSGYVLKSNGSTSVPTWIAQSSLSVGSATQLQTARTIWGQSFDGTGNVSGSLSGVGAVTSSYWEITFYNSNRVLFSMPGHYIQTGNDRYLYIGPDTSKGLVINTSGNVTINGSLLTTAGITMYSDIRKKTKLADVELTLQQIANAPLIKHYYNSDETKTTHVGSIAQYWANMNDWFCKEDVDGYYTMEILNAALASAISVARELVKYESKTDKTIRLLKQRVNQLEDEVKRLKEN